MDPDANLEEQRSLSESILEALDVDEDEEVDMDAVRDDANRLAELVQALDQWISRGGFLPKDWRRP